MDALNMTAGYKALREGAAWLDLTGRGVIRVTGEDRARLLHAMTTNHVQQLKPGEWCYAFFLSAQGRMLADVNVLCEDGALVLDTEPETRTLVFEHLDKFIIADDVELEDRSDGTAVVSLEGPKAAEVARKAGLESPWTVSSTGAEGVRFFVPVEDKAELIRNLEASGAIAASTEEAHIVRLEHAKPRYGADLSDAHIPHEARFLGAVHFSKGCYLGQEIVERVRARTKPSRLLTHFVVAGGESVAVGAIFTAQGEAVGKVTSSAYSPAQNQVLALGYIREGLALPGTKVNVDGREATATDLLK